MIEVEIDKTKKRLHPFLYRFKKLEVVHTNQYMDANTNCITKFGLYVNHMMILTQHNFKIMCLN